MHKVKINLTSGGRGTIEIDGQPVPGVVGLAIVAGADKPPSVTLSILGEIEMTADEASVVTHYLDPSPPTDHSPAPPTGRRGRDGSPAQFMEITSRQPDGSVRTGFVQTN